MVSTPRHDWYCAASAAGDTSSSGSAMSAAPTAAVASPVRIARQRDERRADGSGGEPGTDRAAAWDGEGEGGEREDLHAHAERHGERRAPAPLPLQRDEGEDDQGGDERVALRVLHPAQHLEEEQRLGEQRAPGWQHALDGDEEEQPVEQVPAEQREGPGDPGEGLEEQREGRAVLEPVGVLGGILGVQVLSRQQVARRGAEDLEVAGRLCGMAQLIARAAGGETARHLVDARIRGERLAAGVGDGDEEIQRDEDAPEAGGRNGGEARRCAVEHHGVEGSREGRADPSTALGMTDSRGGPARRREIRRYSTP